ncbi:lipoate--protein ligase [Bacilli bacterium]|nr:lipoate--protein ligase [Bacilli bacterium]GHU43204.1 lipoate--protein ligase [Bacilli bacterium]
MRYLTTLETDATYNIAMDAWLLNTLRPKEPIFVIWQNKKAVIVGQNQNTFAEVNQEFIEANEIQVVRRVTGGGAVFHDLGNLNFTFIVPVADAATVNFKKFVEPMLRALHALNIPAELSGRNDLMLDGKKISGNAQRYANGYLMHHGTLLFDSNVDNLVNSLNVADEKFISKAAKSVRSRVGMIKDYAPEGTTVKMFYDALIDELSNHGADQEIILNLEQLAEIKTLQEKQFSQWDWNYGKSPASNFHNHAKFDGGSVDVLAQVENGVMQTLRFEGDFLGLHDLAPVITALTGQVFDKTVILRELQALPYQDYFGSISIEEIAGLFVPVRA